jgi:hypothetical protein
VNGFVEKGGCGGLPSQALDSTVHLRTSKRGLVELLVCISLMFVYAARYFSLSNPLELVRGRGAGMVDICL